MPRNGQGVYSKPPGTTAAPNTKIESAKFNSVVDDFVQDANAARPVTAGGTGAATDSEARTNLGLEIGTDILGISYAPPGLIKGLTLSNNAADATNDLDVAVGAAAGDGATPVLMALASAMTKRLDAAWAVGSGSGGWLDGSSMPDGTGHVFLIQRSDTGAVDVGMSASLNPSLPTNYDRKRRIGSILRESGALARFVQLGNLFSRHAQVVERDSASALPSTTISLSVPIGIKVRPIIACQLITPASSNIAVNWGNGDSGIADLLVQTAFTGTGETASDTAIISNIVTNAARQVYVSVIVASGSITSNRFRTLGWIDER